MESVVEDARERRGAERRAREIMARRPEDPTWVPPPRIVMVKAFPGEDVVLVKPELFAECSRRRYLALSDGVKSRFAQAHASSRTRYRKLWRRLLGSHANVPGDGEGADKVGAVANEYGARTHDWT